jgi:hypothetical protein
MNKNAFKKIEALSDRILSGKVVFFIGAGFSFESEGNSAERFMRRLIVRFEAITDILMKVKQRREELKEIAKELQKSLEMTFLSQDRKKNDGNGEKKELYHEENIRTLSNSYYQVNDWICSAYSELLEEMKKFEEKEKENLCTQINQRENKLLKSNDDEPLEPIELKKYKDLEFHKAGKALFLDTMGFDNNKIMGGTPFKLDINDVLKSYHQRLLKRHHILARLAREGLFNPLITTNYDLLLEGAYRLAGFDRGVKDIDQPGATVLCPYFECIADANQFFDSGSPHRTAVITKIHGCVRRYRQAKKIHCNNLDQNTQDSNQPGINPGNSDWSKYLPSMVFTFREIQNWREDAWSRDYIRTLLRTRTIVFCGYSAADPVLHDTFRSVYEEMEKQREKSILDSKKNKQSLEPKIPAFFFGLEKKKEFHGMEILRAAGKAIGSKAHKITNHDNYLQFYENEQNDKFPNLDELMSWLYHLTCRNIQAQCVENNLYQTTMHLFGHPCPLKELENIKDEFWLLFDKEKECARKWDDSPGNRQSLYRVTNWSEYFHPGFLREFAIAENQMFNPGLRAETRNKFSPYWYYPLTERPVWTAWAVVVEIALRKMVSAWQGCFDNWIEIINFLEIIPGVTPALKYSQGNELNTPILLEIKVPGSEPVKFPAKIPGAFRKKLTWDLDQRTLPWPQKDYRDMPGAKTLWIWAAKKDTGNMTMEEIKKLDHYLGEKI